MSQVSTPPWPLRTQLAEPAPGIVAFLHHEAALLDARRLQEWLELFEPDGRLWVPGRSDEPDPNQDVSIIFDHLPRLRMRVARLLSGRDPAQSPPSNTIRQISNLSVVASDGPDDLLHVTSVTVIYESRAARPLLVLPTRTTHCLRAVEDSWGIVEKRIDLLEVGRHFENLAFLL